MKTKDRCDEILRLIDNVLAEFGAATPASASTAAGQDVIRYASSARRAR